MTEDHPHLENLELENLEETVAISSKRLRVIISKIKMIILIILEELHSKAWMELLIKLIKNDGILNKKFVNFSLVQKVQVILKLKNFVRLVITEENISFIN